MSNAEYTLPDVGEGLTEAEIVGWKVAPGDTVALNQVLVEIETAKSLVELPSPYAGTISELLFDEGTTVEVGTPIIRFTTSGEPAPVTATIMAIAETTGTAESEEEPDEKPGAVLVGYGIKGHVASRRRRATGTPDVAPAAQRPRPTSVPASEALPIIAKPPIRKLAKDLDVDLSIVTATGLAGEITRDDVIRQAQQASVFRNIQTPEWSPEREERIPVKGVRKAIATAMTQSAFTAPHVSVFVDIDATRTMEFVKRLKNFP